jgi:hypothetical protein
LLTGTYLPLAGEASRAIYIPARSLRPSVSGTHLALADRVPRVTYTPARSPHPSVRDTNGAYNEFVQGIVKEYLHLTTCISGEH